MEFEIELNGKAYTINPKAILSVGCVAAADIASFYAACKLTSAPFDLLSKHGCKGMTKAVVWVGGKLIGASVGLDAMTLVNEAAIKALRSAGDNLEKINSALEKMMTEEREADDNG